MIPLTLTLSGFLSYRDPVEIDFTAFDLACITGHNGAGKSSLLDAITWALFGQARKTGDALIHTACPAAEVSLVFAYESNTYRVQRTLPRGKTTLLEFHIAQQGAGSEGDEALSPSTLIAPLSSLSWKPLTERTLRDTQARIKETLRLDYDTFVNASFFLQGKADQFTQQQPGDRKRILGSILGLETWEAYRQRAAERRKTVEAEIAALDGRLAEIAAELAEEDARRDHLKTLNRQLKGLQKTRSAQEMALEQIRKMAAALQSQRQLVDSLARQVESAKRRLADLELRVAARQTERESYIQVVSRAPAIQAAYQAWQVARQELENWETISAQFREHEKRRQPFLDALNAERARLLQEQQTLLDQQSSVISIQSSVSGIQQQITEHASRITAAEAQLAERAALDARLQEARQRQADAKAENPRLKTEMDELKTRIDRLSAAEGADCPLCGQPLTPQDRQRLIAELTAQGKTLGDRYRANQALLSAIDQTIAENASRITSLASAEQARLSHTQSLAALAARLDQARQIIAAWEAEGQPRLAEVAASLEQETFGLQARHDLAAIDTELKAIGYDAAAHDAARAAELAGRAAETDLRELEKAQAALAPLDREIEDLNGTRNTQQIELERLQSDQAAASSALASAETSTPDLDAAEQELLAIQEQENRLHMEVGAARQKVDVLADLKTRRAALDAQRESMARQIGQYKQLERAFGKDGVPALLIEQALPQIEARANDILDRLSAGGMAVRFVTQAAYKDKKREDLKETLDIQISDDAGTRDYEMFSIDGSEPVYIRRNGRIITRKIRELWDERSETKVDGEYEFQNADFEALCYENGKSAWLPAQSILRHPAPKEMLKLTLAPGKYSVTITPNHSIIVMTAEGPQIKRGDEIQTGDYVLTPRNVPTEKIQEKVDLIDWISPEFIAKRQNNNKELNWNSDLIWSRIDQPINRFIQNEETLAEFLGFVVAEGSGRKAYTISAGSDAGLAQKVVDLSNSLFGLARKSTVRVSAEQMIKYTAKADSFASLHPKEQYRPFVGGRLVTHILGNMAGHGAYWKHIPEFIFNAPPEAKMAFLMGLISGDGHIRIRPKKSQVEISVTTISPQLVADTIFLCRQLGIWACVGKHGNAGFRRGAHHQLSYRMSINGGANAGKLIDPQISAYSTQTAFDGIPLDLIGIVRNTKQRRLKRISLDAIYPCGARVVPKRSQGAYQELSRCLEAWAVLEVASIEKVYPTTPFVYDLVVPENHTFVAGTGLILVHNSGGEAFRANFAIRLALSEVLAQRAGARLQTLVIDEGFGSQDAQGRQRLIEAINLVKPDFAKILVITHIDELKDAFPTRIEVEKTPQGSAVRIM